MAACTIVTSSHGSSLASILDPINNKPLSNSAGDSFDVGEIRDAFFRFFVASFADYQDFFALSSTCATSCCTSVNTSSAATPAALAALKGASGAINNGSTETVGVATTNHSPEAGDSNGNNNSNTDTRPKEQIYFNTDAYQAHLQDPFLCYMYDFE